MSVRSIELIFRGREGLLGSPDSETFLRLGAIGARAYRCRLADPFQADPEVLAGPQLRFQARSTEVMLALSLIVVR